MTVNFNLGFVADAAGTVDAITATYTPTYTVLLDKMLVWFRATGANTSATPTFAPNGLAAHTIVKQGGQPLVAGDIPAAGAVMNMVYDASNTRWELVNPAPTPYKKYLALLTQTGTDAPVATVLENTIGNIAWSYVAAGYYRGTLASAFTANKRWRNIAATPNDDVTEHAFTVFESTSIIAVSTVDGGITNQDDILVETPIEIRVYQ